MRDQDGDHRGTKRGPRGTLGRPERCEQTRITTGARMAVSPCFQGPLGPWPFPLFAAFAESSMRAHKKPRQAGRRPTH